MTNCQIIQLSWWFYAMRCFLSVSESYMLVALRNLIKFRSQRVVTFMESGGPDFSVVFWKTKVESSISRKAGQSFLICYSFFLQFSFHHCEIFLLIVTRWIFNWLGFVLFSLWVFLGVIEVFLVWVRMLLIFTENSGKICKVMIKKNLYL